MQGKRSILREFINLQFGLDRQVSMNTLKDTISGPCYVDNEFLASTLDEVDDQTVFVSEENKQISVIDRLKAVE